MLLGVIHAKRQARPRAPPVLGAADLIHLPVHEKAESIFTRYGNDLSECGAVFGAEIDLLAIFGLEEQVPNGGDDGRRRSLGAGEERLGDYDVEVSPRIRVEEVADAVEAVGDQLVTERHAVVGAVVVYCCGDLLGVGIERFVVGTGSEHDVEDVGA